MLYSQEDKEKIVEFSKRALLNLISMQKIEFPTERVLHEFKGVKIVLNFNGKEMEEIVFPRIDSSLAENIVLGFEKVLKKINISESEIGNVDLKISIFSYPSRILDSVEKKFELGKEGLVVEYMGYRGVLFPPQSYKDKI